MKLTAKAIEEHEARRRKAKKRKKVVARYLRAMDQSLNFFENLNAVPGDGGEMTGGCQSVATGEAYDWSSNYYMLGLAMYGAVLASIPLIGSTFAATTALGGTSVYSANWWLDAFCNSAETQLFKVVPGLGDLMEQQCAWVQEYRDAYLRQVRSMVAAVIYGEAAMTAAITSESHFLPIRILQILYRSQARIVCFFSQRSEELYLLLKKHRRRAESSNKRSAAAAAVATGAPSVS